MIESDIKIGHVYRQSRSAVSLYRYKRADVVVTALIKEDYGQPSGLVEGYYIDDPKKAIVWWWISNFLEYYVPVIHANQIWKKLNEN